MFALLRLLPVMVGIVQHTRRDPKVKKAIERVRRSRARKRARAARRGK